MNFIKHYSRILFFFLGLVMVGVSCKKDVIDDPQPQPALAPSITSIDPATAPVGSTIAVNGTNFDSAAVGTTVSIGGVSATIVSITSTRIVVTVPTGAVAGPISVTTGGQTVQSTVSFTPSATVPTPAGAKPVAEKQGTYFRNQSWSSDTVYVLRGKVYIPENFTLTIAPGTIIKGAGPESDPSGTNQAGALIIERRAQLIARGTAAQPIIFTSAKAAGGRNPGDWGGVVLIGKSPINRPRATPYPNGIRNTIEAYGEPFDNSGALQYVRIEYAGAGRLAGLSMIGVGNATTIDHVQVSYSASDAFAWFGGSVNAKNLYAYRNADDDWTVDWGYVGNVQFGVALRNPATADQSGSNGFEIENFDTDQTTDVEAVVPINGYTQRVAVFSNMSNFAYSTTPTTTAGGASYGAGIYLRRNSTVSIYNSLVYGYPEGIHLESVASATGITNGITDLKGIVLANVLTPIVGGGATTTEQVTAYVSGAGRANVVIASTDVASLLLNANTFTLDTPNFVPQAGSPILAGAITGDKLTNAFFSPVTYRGAFGTENWLAGWTSVTPQTTAYDR
ncbi:IPT/TIG domain-containing protein [Spirosoma utsteinense]|uniref:IPT/TIG domain-containing protein n=1 Tax=Spirosoma utsteinense TaxID=2585773 RepID=A0ABR6W7X6_9BACT|nr:IPT/TIG domain-containing protein [Spirosoma utsteinense]MBC3787722.1 hypothetical protein [Spirosoma utsteinense]MBC3792674.1 hypothetical protein [Spirosoma utsteinense]